MGKVELVEATDAGKEDSRGGELRHGVEGLLHYGWVAGGRRGGRGEGGEGGEGALREVGEGEGGGTFAIDFIFAGGFGGDGGVGN